VAQTEQSLNNIGAILAKEGLNFEHVVSSTVYLKDMEDFALMNSAYSARFNSLIKPSRTTIQAAKLPKSARVEITCIALRNMNHKIHRINTEYAPQAIGPYSQAISAGPFLFLSGQIPMHPEGAAITVEDIEDQTEQVMNNMGAILAQANMSFDNVVSSTVYLQDMGDFAVMNKIYAGRFNNVVKPSRTTIQAAKLPKEARVEITCIAFRNMSSL
ncbi:MAG: hypothetical protein JSR46_05790, partial [Verrucomicrobia bacterium]|nr:hypothetical protein [Verrucomicrobiota bacterium]